MFGQDTEHDISMIYRILAIKGLERDSRILLTLLDLPVEIAHKHIQHLLVSPWRQIHIDLPVDGIEYQHPCALQVQLLEMHIHIPLYRCLLVQVDHVHQHLDIELLLSRLRPHGVRKH